MDKKALQARLEKLIAQHSQVIATVNAIGGRISECRLWLQAAEVAEASKAEPPAEQPPGSEQHEAE